MVPLCCIFILTLSPCSSVGCFYGYNASGKICSMIGSPLATVNMHLLQHGPPHRLQENAFSTMATSMGCRESLLWCLYHFLPLLFLTISPLPPHPKIQERHRQTGDIPKEGHRNYQKTGELDLWGKTEGTRCFLPGKGKEPHQGTFQGNLITVFQYLQGGYKEDRHSLFTRSHMENTRHNRYKLHGERFILKVRNNFFTLRKIIYWKSFPRNVVEFPLLEDLEMQLDRVLGNLI